MPKVVAVVNLGEREPGVTEYSVEAEQGADPRRAMFERLAERGWPILSLRSTDLTLEEVFINLTNGTYAAGQKTKQSNKEVEA